jgi:hypothetical protein
VTDEPQTERLFRGTAWAILASAGLLVVAASWGYLTDGQAPYGDDNSAHLALMMHIADLWRSGITALWWNQSNLGLPLFMAYQPLPGLVSGTLAAPLADTGARIFLYKLTVIGLWATMPAAWYLGARWLGFDRVASLVFGLATLAVRDIHAVGFGFTAVAHGGLYTLVWGMWFLPMCVGAFRRYVIERDLPLVVPVSLFVATSMSHLFCGMYAGIATLTMVLTAGRDYRARLGRTLKVYLPALALMAFWLGPLLWTNHLAGGLPWKNEYYNGWPAVELFRHLFGGDVFDHDRLPWLTILVFVGVGICVQRASRARDRWMLTLGGLTLLLFMGRTNFGGWYDLLPMHDQINVMRYTAAIHFCGLMFAAVAGRQLWARLANWVGDPRTLDGRTAAALALAISVGGWCVVDRFQFVQRTLKTFDQTHPNVKATVDALAEGRGTRFAVSDHLNTSPHFFRDLFPALSGRGQLQSYALGYHATLSTYYADYIDYGTTWSRLFNVGGFLAREPYRRDLVDHLQETHHEGPYHVLQHEDAADWGYFDFVRTPAAIQGDYHAIRPAVRELLKPGFKRRALPRLVGPTDASVEAQAPILASSNLQEAIEWDGRDRREWRAAFLKAADEKPIDSEIVSSSRGRHWYEAKVRADGDRERLMLKVNYFPFWQATVDGKPVEIDHIAPNFMAIDVPAGTHRIRFVYTNPWWQKLGLVMTLLILTGWGAWRRRRGSDE